MFLTGIPTFPVLYAFLALFGMSCNIRLHHTKTHFEGYSLPTTSLKIVSYSMNLMHLSKSLTREETSGTKDDDPAVTLSKSQSLPRINLNTATVYYSSMGFFDYLGTFVKRIIFFIGGFIVAFPLAGTVAFMGSTVNRSGVLPTTDYYPISIIIAIALFIVGLAMMGYAFKLK